MKEVVLRFGIPKIMISNNGTQFVRRKFEERLAELYIQHRKASVKHPQANGQVEVTSKTLLVGVKKHLDEAKRVMGRRAALMSYGPIELTPNKQPEKPPSNSPMDKKPSP